MPLPNRYTYVGNNPVNYVDPYGLWGPDLTPDFVDDAADEVGGALGSAADVAENTVDEVAESTADFVSDPSNLASVGQIVGGVLIATTCVPPTIVIVCAAGLSIYTYASLLEIATADSQCEAAVAAVTSAVGAYPLAGLPSYLVAGFSGFFDGLACPSTAYAHGGPYLSQNKE